LRGRKPTKRQRARDQRCHRGGGPGQHLDRQAGGDARPDEHETGIADERHPGVGDERDHYSRAHPRHELYRAFALIVFVIADQACLDAVAVEQYAGATRVLASDHIGVAERR